MDASFCNFDRLQVQVGVFIVVCVAEKLGFSCFFELLLVYCCILYVFLPCMMLLGFQCLCRRKKKKKKKENGLSSFEVKASEDSRCIFTTHAANTWCWALWQHRTPGTERVSQSTVVTEQF